MVWQARLIVVIIACCYIHNSLANTLPNEEKDDEFMEIKDEFNAGETGILDAAETLPTMIEEDVLDTIGAESLDTRMGAESETVEEESSVYDQEVSDTDDEKEGLYTYQSHAESCSSLDSGQTRSRTSTFVSDGTVHITKASDCTALYEAGIRQSGIYQLHIEDPGSRRPLTPQVYCELSDSDIDGGGWTYIQSRVDDSVDFHRYWDEYEDGFGDPTRNFWLGLKAMHQLTSKQQTTELMVHLETFVGSSRYAHYEVFIVGHAATNYRLSIDGYSGNAGNDLEVNNNMMFTTRDRHNDRRGDNCANRDNFIGAWWFDNCSDCHLNGVYYPATYTGTRNGIHWRSYRGIVAPPVLKKVSMKIRRKKI